MVMKKLSVVYATKGGMGDAGKFAAAFAATDPEIDARIVSLSRDEIEGGTNGISDEEVDVTDASLRSQLAKDLNGVKILHADVDNTKATTEVLETAFDGVDAVVACVGSRQGSFGRWVSRGGELIIEAMKKRQVKRLVIMSSMGINHDFIPFGAIKVVWGMMLATNLRGVKRDITRLEQIVSESDLDYLLVRPVGLTPEEPPKPREQWKIMTEKGGSIRFSISKKDVARFMVDEALNPTYSKTAVLLGSQPKNAHIAKTE